MSHQKIIHYNVVDDEGYTINSSQQMVEQIQVIQEVVLQELSKLYDSVMKKTTTRFNAVFCSKVLEKK